MAFSENLKTGQAYRVMTDEDPITGTKTYDRLSFWTDARDVEFTNHTTLEEISDTFYYASAVLAAGNTSVTVSGDNISANGLVDIYVPDEFCKVTPNSIVRGDRSITITFPAQSEDMEVRVVCKSLSNINAENNSQISGG